MIVEGMTCGHCVSTITNAIQQLDPTAHVDIDLVLEEVNVAGSITADAAVAAIQDAGYSVVAILELGSDPGPAVEATTANRCCGTCRT